MLMRQYARAVSTIHKSGLRGFVVEPDDGLNYLQRLYQTANRDFALSIVRRRDSMERLMSVVLMITLIAFMALIFTGCLVGIYWLVGLMM